MNYFLSPSKVTIINNSKPIVIDVANPDFSTIKKALLEEDFIEAQRLLDNPTPTHEFTHAGNKVTIEADTIMYNGEPLQHGFVSRLQHMRAEGLKDPTPWLMFLERIMNNPSQRIRETLHTFIEDKHMALTSEGKVLAYKGVKSDLYDRFSGTIYNGIGHVISMKRNDVDDNAENTCSNGLHVGDYEYAKCWAGDGQLLLVEFDPADAVSVPIDGQKLRTSEYKVLKAINPENPLKESLYQIDPSNHLHPMSSAHPSYQRAKDWLTDYLDDANGWPHVTVESLCDKFDGLSRRDVGRLTADCDACLSWSESANDYLVQPNNY